MTFFSKISPPSIFEKLKWINAKNKLKSCGKHSRMAKGFVITGHENISIGENSTFGINCSIETWKKYNGVTTGYLPKVIIQNNVTFTRNCYISCLNFISIGKGSLFGDNCFITDNFHGEIEFDELSVFPRERKLYSKGPIIIGENVWVGRNVCILPNVQIGNGAIIGANAVVCHDVPDFCVVGGVPAKIIRNLKKAERI